MASVQGERELIEFGVVMAREFPAVRVEQLQDLVRLARRHGRLQEKVCNEAVREGHNAACEKKIAALCAEIGCAPVFGGDPRGVTVKLKVPSGRTNDWGGDGVCVPQ